MSSEFYMTIFYFKYKLTIGRVWRRYNVSNMYRFMKIFKNAIESENIS